MGPTLPTLPTGLHGVPSARLRILLPHHTPALVQPPPSCRAPDFQQCTPWDIPRPPGNLPAALWSSPAAPAPSRVEPRLGQCKPASGLLLPNSAHTLQGCFGPEPSALLLKSELRLSARSLPGPLPAHPHRYTLLPLVAHTSRPGAPRAGLVGSDRSHGLPGPPLPLGPRPGCPAPQCVTAMSVPRLGDKTAASRSSPGVWRSVQGPLAGRGPKSTL